MVAAAVVVWLGWILSVCIHEFGHAIVAYWGGDTSVKDKGYLTLNPLKYTDINLSLILPIIFLIIGGIALPGAAVYIEKRRLRDRWWQSAVSAAGPIASAIVTLLLALPFMLGLASPYGEYGWLWSALAFLIYLEILAIIINSLPIPFLDGYGVIEPWLPSKSQLRLRRFSEPALFFIFMLLWYVEPLRIFLGSLSTAIAQTLGVSTEMIGVGFALFNKSSGILILVAIGAILLICAVTDKQHERWYDKGNAFSKSGRYEEAIASYDKAIQIKPEVYLAWHQRGFALFNFNRYKEAIASYDKAIQINPNSDESWCWRGCTLDLLQKSSGEFQLKVIEGSNQIATQSKPPPSIAISLP